MSHEESVVGLVLLLFDKYDICQLWSVNIYSFFGNCVGECTTTKDKHTHQCMTWPGPFLSHFLCVLPQLKNIHHKYFSRV